MKKIWGFLITMLISAFIISGCGSGQEETNSEENMVLEEDNADVAEKENEAKNVNQEGNVTQGENTGDEEESDSSATTTAEPSGDFAKLISFMEEETEGTATVLYENNEPQVHEMKGVSVSLDAYTLIELKDFHSNFSIPFNDQTDGGVIIAKYTVTNELDEDVYYMPAFYLSFTGAQKDYNNQKYLLPEEEQLVEKLSYKDDYLLKAGESVTGYYTYPFGQNHLEAVLEVSTATVDVPAAQAVKGEFGNPIGSDGQFNLSLNEAGAKKVETNAKFYQDRVTTEDMGEKVMLKEESGIGKSEPLRDVTVNLDGYQFTEFIPNEEEAPRFTNFPNGIVLLTVRFELDNKGTETIGLSSNSSKLTVNDGTQYVLGTGMLLNYGSRDVVEAGETGQLLQIFALDKEQYEKIWKDKSFKIELGPLRNEESKDISKGARVEFEL